MPPKRSPASVAPTSSSTSTTTKPSSSSTTSTKPSTSSTTKPSSTTTTTTKPSSSPFTPTKPSSTTSSSTTDARTILLGLWDNYTRDTPQRVKLVDAFMGFLILVGGVQFLYAVVGGNYPFNAFLAGFSATVGQFVLTASLRIQSNPRNKNEFRTVSPERAFADFVLGSLILHFFCVNFIN